MEIKIHPKYIRGDKIYDKDFDILYFYNNVYINKLEKTEENKKWILDNLDFIKTKNSRKLKIEIEYNEEYIFLLLSKPNVFELNFYKIFTSPNTEKRYKILGRYTKISLLVLSLSDNQEYVCQLYYSEDLPYFEELINLKIDKSRLPILPIIDTFIYDDIRYVIVNKYGKNEKIILARIFNLILFEVKYKFHYIGMNFTEFVNYDNKNYFENFSKFIKWENPKLSFYNLWYNLQIYIKTDISKKICNKIIDIIKN